MSSSKKYYWLKLKEDFFNDKALKKLRRMAGGDTYTIIYLKMMLKSLKDEGKIFYEGIEDDFAEEIALDIDERTEDVQMTIMYLLKTGLMEQISTSEAVLTQMSECIGTETANAEIMRQRRAETRRLNDARVTMLEKGVTMLPDGVTKLSDVKKSYTEIEIENRDRDKYNSCPPDDGRVDDLLPNGLRKSDEKREIEKCFETCWAEYLRKEGKGGVKPAAKREMYKDGVDVVLEGVRTYNAKQYGKDRQYVKMGSTFFNQLAWRDYVAEEPVNVADLPDDIRPSY